MDQSGATYETSIRQPCRNKVHQELTSRTPRNLTGIKRSIQKKARTSPEIPTVTKRQTKINDYWLNKPVLTNNSFEALEVEGTQVSVTGTPRYIADEDEEKTKSPPIYIDGVENVAPLKIELDKIAKDQYTIKILKNNQVKIQSLSTIKYIPIMESLKQKGSQGFTYQCKQDKNFKVVLRNMYPSTDVQDIKAEIEAQNHKVIKITNILETKTEKPLPLFFIEIQQRENNKDVYNIKQLLNTIISFEQP